MVKAARDGAARPAFRRGNRIGLGDLAVLVAFALLIWVVLSPHVDGRRAAGREGHARQALVTLQALLGRAGVDAAYERAMHDLLADGGELRACQESPDGAAQEFLPLLQDDGYWYRPQLLPRPDTPCVFATPRRPWNTGRLAMAIRGDGRLEETPLPEPPLQTQDPTLGPMMDTAEATARATVKRILAAWLAAGLPSASLTFRQLVAENQIGLRPTEPRPDEAASRLCPLELHSDSHAFRLWPIASGSRVELELWTWPLRPARTGFAAYRLTAGEGMQLSRNMVTVYGRKHGPLPGAGVPRPGSKRENEGYTGYDGNRWFRVPDSP
jgi:hypothetical protein